MGAKICTPSVADPHKCMHSLTDLPSYLATDIPWWVAWRPYALHCGPLLSSIVFYKLKAIDSQCIVQELFMHTYCKQSPFVSFKATF